MLSTPIRRIVLFATACVIFSSLPAYAVPVTFHFQGSVPSWGVDSLFTSPAVAVGDSFTGSVTYESGGVEDYSFPGVACFYQGDVLGLTITFQTSGGPVTYASDNTLNSLVINQVAVWDSRVSIEVTDFDRDGTQAPVTGPNEPGEYNGNPLDFDPIYVRFEAAGDFSAYVNSNIQPSPSTILNADWLMVAISFQAQIAPNSHIQGWYYGAVESAWMDQAPIVPEPATAMLVGLGLAGWRCFRSHRRRRDQ